MSEKYSCFAKNVRILGMISICWLAFWQLYLNMGSPHLSFWNFIFAFLGTGLAGSITIGIAALFFEKLVCHMDDTLFLIFPMLFPFFLLGAQITGEKLTNTTTEIHASLKEKTQEEQFHLVDYVRKLLN